MKTNNLPSFEYLEANYKELEHSIFLVRHAMMICNALETNLTILRTKCRKQEIVLKRVVFTKLMKKYAKNWAIAEILKTDHSNIQSYLKKELKYDKKLEILYYKTEKQLYYF